LLLLSELNHTSAEPNSKEKMTFFTSTDNNAGPGSKENFNSLMAEQDGTDIIEKMY